MLIGNGRITTVGSLEFNCAAVAVAFHENYANLKGESEHPRIFSDPVIVTPFDRCKNIPIFRW